MKTFLVLDAAACRQRRKGAFTRGRATVDSKPGRHQPTTLKGAGRIAKSTIKLHASIERLDLFGKLIAHAPFRELPAGGFGIEPGGDVAAHHAHARLVLGRVRAEAMPQGAVMNED